MSMTIASTADTKEDIFALLAVISDPTAAAAALADIKVEQEALAAQKAGLSEQENALRKSTETHEVTVARAHAAQQALMSKTAAHERRLTDFNERKMAFVMEKAERIEHERQLAAREKAAKEQDAKLTRFAANLAAREEAVVERELRAADAAKRLTDAIAATRL